MQILRRDPGKAYYSNVLSLPKTHTSEAQLEGSLSYDLGREKGYFSAWTEDRHHFHVPRNYVLEPVLRKMQFPVVDARIRRFPRSEFKSNVELDKRDPSQRYQRDGVSSLLAVQNGILVLRCGAGKSVCGIHAIGETKVPGLIVVNDLGLAKQWIEEIEAFTNLKKSDIGYIGNGRFDWKKPIAVGLVQTLAARAKEGAIPREMVEHFGVVLEDEVHNTGGPAYYNQAVTPFHGRRWGLTATPLRNDAYDTLLRYTFGEVVYSYLMPEIKPLIFFRQLQTQLDISRPEVASQVLDTSRSLHLGMLYGYLSTREDRTAVIVREIKGALKEGRQLLVLSQSKDMVERLAKSFPSCGMIHGSVPEEGRTAIIRNHNPVIAISKLGKQALNKPTLDTLFVIDPYTSAGALQQLLGRIQREHPDKQQALAVFYEDVHIDRLHGMCKRIRKLFNNWPEDQGGRMRFSVIGDPEAEKQTTSRRISLR